jgi:hypothetical protein
VDHHHRRCGVNDHASLCVVVSQFSNAPARQRPSLRKRIPRLLDRC